MKKYFGTQGALQRELGIGKSTMSRWVRRDDWPVRRCPVWDAGDLFVIRRWQAELQPNRADPACGDFDSRPASDGRRRPSLRSHASQIMEKYASEGVLPDLLSEEEQRACGLRPDELAAIAADAARFTDAKVADEK
jgi:hypothetical protein